MTVLMKTPTQSDTMESALIRGDLAQLTSEQRVDYYNAVCKSLGLNPLTSPFAFITLNGKLVLYALRACADQLRKINGVSLEIVSRETAHDILTIHVRAKLPDGRVDEDLGSVSFPETLKGEARANAELKAVTKAKRRATLSICGLGWLDETEIADIPASAKKPVAAPNVMLASPPLPPHDPETGEIAQDWITFGQDMIAAAKSAPNGSEQVLKNHAVNIARMEKDAPKVYNRMMAAIEKAKASQPLPNDDPEAYLKWLTAQCAAINEPSTLHGFAKGQNDAIKSAFPPDAEQARHIIATREKALENA
jgi:hypothetical protein